MAAALAHPVHAHVAFLRLSRFEGRPAAEQAALKDKLENAALAALAAVAKRDRIVLDAEDGIALVLFGDAERALDVAQAVRRAPGGPELQVGLNYGPLALSAGGSEARVFGDGLTAAAAAARFAEPSRPLVTEEFARALRATAPDRARELADAGDFTDTRVRIHRFLAPDPALRTARRRRIALYAAGGVAAILLLGVIGRNAYQSLLQSRPGVVQLEVKPRADVFLDGVSQGRVPPLTQIEVTPGRHRLALRSPGYRPVEIALDVKPGQRLTVTQTLQRLPEAKPDLWRDLKRKFGS